MTTFDVIAQNMAESGDGIQEAIGDFHDGFRYRLVTANIMGQLLAESLDWLDALLDTVGWEDSQEKEVHVCDCGSTKMPKIVAPIQYMKCPDCGGRRKP
jgi:hypothetical protein